MSTATSFLHCNNLQPFFYPLGEDGLLVRFADRLSEVANRAAIALAARTATADIEGVREVTPNLVSVLVTYAPDRIDFTRLAGEVRLLLSTLAPDDIPGQTYTIPVQYGGAHGPDLDAVAAALGFAPDAFIAAHRGADVRVLAAGFAPGFVYCGVHEAAMDIPRRTTVRTRVPAGSILFAGGLTAVTATPIPTGWAVIGRTRFDNFDPARMPPTTLRPGDVVRFREETP